MRRTLLPLVALAALGCPAQPPVDVSSPAVPDVAERAAPVAMPAPVPVVRPLSANARLENERNTIDIVRAASPAVAFVTQKSVVRSWTGLSEVPSGSGSAFVWDTDGHIVTNYHVVDGGRARTALTVTLHNGKTYDAEFVGGDANKDIAVLRIDAPSDSLVPIQLPSTAFEPVVGQKTIAIGNPFGLDHTVTTGIVSATGRELIGYGQVTIRDMIQTDASINPGNSGGPLLNSSGELIGMNTMIFSNSGSSAGIGFAVPVSTVRRVVPQVIRTGHVERVGLGVRILPDRQAAALGIEGVVIGDVQPGSSAEKAGLRGTVATRYELEQLGDVIVGIDGDEIANYDDLFTALDGRRSTEEVEVVYIRDGKQQTTKVPLQVLTPR